MLVKMMSGERSLGKCTSARSGLKLGKSERVSKTAFAVLLSTLVMTMTGY